MIAVNEKGNCNQAGIIWEGTMNGAETSTDRISLAGSSGLNAFLINNKAFQC